MTLRRELPEQASFRVAHHRQSARLQRGFAVSVIAARVDRAWRPAFVTSLSLLCDRSTRLFSAPIDAHAQACAFRRLVARRSTQSW
jgi:hypothetical protein